jgi:hypothetical protein
MQKLKFFFCILFSVAYTFSKAQDAATVQEYINTYRELAISEMKRTGIPASIKLAQGIHETNAGTSDLVLKSNNHFGLKCKKEWMGMKVSHTDDAPNECFRKYTSPVESYKDQSDYLRNQPRYASLFTLDPLDYKGWAKGLKQAGYATNPKYTQVLIKLIEEYNLQDFTLIALGKKKSADESLVKNETKTEPAATAVKFSIDKPVVMPDEPEIIVKSVRKDNKNEIKKAETAPMAVSPKAEIRKQEPVTEAIVVKNDPAPVYPDGEFKINDTRVIFAKKGTSFLAIAERYKIPLAWIFDFNEMNIQEFTEKDQLIYIMRKRKTGLNELHTVKPGETLADIAQSQAMRLESLMEYNYLKPGWQPAIGSVLYLRTKAPAMPALAYGK